MSVRFRVRVKVRVRFGVRVRAGVSVNMFSIKRVFDQLSVVDPPLCHWLYCITSLQLKNFNFDKFILF